MCAWFTVISVDELASHTSDEVPFLDTFVTIEPKDGDYALLFEGTREMVSIVRFGLIIAWHGPDLKKPDRPPPELFAAPVGDEYYMSKRREYPDTHLLDFLENSGDVLHFKTTHQWAKADIEWYDYGEHTMKYMLVGELRYAQSATRFDKKILGRILPQVPTRTEVNFIGPGFVESRAITIRDLRLNVLVTITPSGPSGTSIYVITNVNTGWIPRGLQSVFDRFSPKSLHDLLAFVFTHAVIDDLSGDYRIWSKRKFLVEPALLPVEENVLHIRKWVQGFYPEGFEYPPETPRPAEEMQWQPLDGLGNIPAGEVKTYNVSGEELVAYRDPEGQVVVLNAFCPHHGAHLGCDSRIDDGLIRCPFHHFYFDSDGKCLGNSPKNKAGTIRHISTPPRQSRVRGEMVEVLV
jgi:phenylpropionate dioxygenase-like ring-hydroxylating dioxygenase large terminal subunit